MVAEVDDDGAGSAIVGQGPGPPVRWPERSWAWVPEVDQNPALAGDQGHRVGEASATIAAHSYECVVGQALGVHRHEWSVCRSAPDDRDVLGAGHLVAVPDGVEQAVVGRQPGSGAPGDPAPLAVAEPKPVVDDGGDVEDGQVVLCCKEGGVLTVGHPDAVADQFGDQGDRG